MYYCWYPLVTKVILSMFVFAWRFQTFIFTLNGSPIYPDPESENLNQADPFSHGGRVAELKVNKNNEKYIIFNISNNKNLIQSVTGRKERQTSCTRRIHRGPSSPDIRSAIFMDFLFGISSSSDSLYSLIIFIYVAVTFLYMFYGFCWRQPEREKPESKDDEDA